MTLAACGAGWAARGDAKFKVSKRRVEYGTRPVPPCLPP